MACQFSPPVTMSRTLHEYHTVGRPTVRVLFAQFSPGAPLSMVPLLEMIKDIEKQMQHVQEKAVIMKQEGLMETTVKGLLEIFGKEYAELDGRKKECEIRIESVMAAIQFCKGAL